MFLMRWMSKRSSTRFFFLDAQDDVLIKRYKETRRQHPLSGSGRVDTGIAKRTRKDHVLEDESDLYIGYK